MTAACSIEGKTAIRQVGRYVLASLACSFMVGVTLAASPQPVALWEFDGNLADTVGGTKPMFFNGNATPRYVGAGEVRLTAGRALALGVEGSDVPCLTVPLTENLVPSAEYTLETWIHPIQVAGDWNRILLIWGAEQGYHFAIHEGRLSLWHKPAEGNYAIVEGGAIEPDCWSHIVAVARLNQKKPGESTLEIYLNGTRIGTTTYNGTIAPVTREAIGIGDAAAGSASGYRFRGYLDSVAIWGQALTAAEIENRFHASGDRAEDIKALHARREAKAREEQKAMLADLREHGIEQIVFSERHAGRDPSGHYYANFGYACTDENEWLHGADGGRLAVLVPATGEVKTLFADPKGAVRDPQVHYSGKKILFSYRRGGTHYYNLHEINVDGSGLRQITEGDWDDVEPTYLPDGGIAFASTRCKRYVLCWLAPVAVLFRCEADGGNIRQLSSGSVTESTPCVLPDGRILYTRWEYINRDAVSFHHLWTMNPDGTGAMAYFGNMHPGGVFIDAQPVPGTHKVAYIDCGYHGTQEHAGTLMLLDLRNGPDDRASAKAIARGGIRDPYPISESLFLAARGNELVQVGGDGKTKTLYRSMMMVHEPRVLAPRRRETSIPSHIDLSESTGTLFLSDVTIGRNMAGVKPGAIKKLLVMEDLPKPVNYHGGGTTPIAHGGTWTLKRILGTVPVEEDGSAFFEAPANRSIYFIALNKDDLCVKQMRSFVTLQPGENASCVGCHDNRITAATSARGLRVAGRRPPSRIEPIEGVPGTFDFPRDIQPILNRHCIKCHNATDRKGGVELTGDRGPTYSLAYYNLILHRQLADNAGYGWPGIRNVGGRPVGNDAPYTTYSYASPLMKKIDGSHHDVKLSADEHKMIRLWIDSAANYAGTYAAYGTGQIGGWWRLNQPIREMDDKWPSTAPARDAMTRRCAGCHENRLPKSVTDQIAIDGFGDLEGWQRPVSRFSRHTIFNLSRPENSMALCVPLAQAAGGFAKGVAPKPKPVPSDVAKAPEPFVHPVIYQSKADPDYGKVLVHLQAAKARLEEIKRFDMPGFKPRREYVREMKRYGVLPAAFDIAKDSIDVYETELAYWRLFRHAPKIGQPVSDAQASRQSRQ